MCQMNDTDMRLIKTLHIEQRCNKSMYIPLRRQSLVDYDLDLS